MLVTYSPPFTPQTKEQSGLGGSCSRAGLSPPRGAPARSRRHHVLPDGPRQGRRRAHGSAGQGSLSCPHETNVHENCRGSTLTQGGGGVAGATSWVSRAREGRPPWENRSLPRHLRRERARERTNVQILKWPRVPGDPSKISVVRVVAPI